MDRRALLTSLLALSTGGLLAGCSSPGSSQDTDRVVTVRVTNAAESARTVQILGMSTDGGPYVERQITVGGGTTDPRVVTVPVRRGEDELLELRTVVEGFGTRTLTYASLDDHTVFVRLGEDAFRFSDD